MRTFRRAVFCRWFLSQSVTWELSVGPPQAPRTSYKWVQRCSANSLMSGKSAFRMRKIGPSLRGHSSFFFACFSLSAMGRIRSEREKEREPRRDDNLRRENWGGSLSSRKTVSGAAGPPASPTGSQAPTMVNSTAGNASASAAPPLSGRPAAEPPRK